MTIALAMDLVAPAPLMAALMALWFFNIKIEVPLIKFMALLFQDWYSQPGSGIQINKPTCCLCCPWTLPWVSINMFK